jgi:hypothetical protein
MLACAALIVLRWPEGSNVSLDCGWTRFDRGRMVDHLAELGPGAKTRPLLSLSPLEKSKVPFARGSRQPRVSADGDTVSRVVLVTGATGYVGGRLVPRLLDAGHRVRCLVRDPSASRAGPGWIRWRSFKVMSSMSVRLPEP